MKSSKWINSATRRRVHAKYRAALCRILNCPIDSCYTTGELRRAAHDERHEEVHARQMEAEYDAKVERETREHYEMLKSQDEEEEMRREFEEHRDWRCATVENRRAEAAWVDNGCAPYRFDASEAF